MAMVIITQSIKYARFPTFDRYMKQNLTLLVCDEGKHSSRFFDRVWKQSLSNQASRVTHQCACDNHGPSGEVIAREQAGTNCETTSACLPRHPTVAYLFLRRCMSTPAGDRRWSRLVCIGLPIFIAIGFIAISFLAPHLFAAAVRLPWVLGLSVLGIHPVVIVAFVYLVLFHCAAWIAPIAARHHMIECSREFNTNAPRHLNLDSPLISICQDLHTDPYSTALFQTPHVTGRPHVVYLDKE
jgi:hypothetical protein